MKKIKIERSNTDSGSTEVLALTVPSSSPCLNLRTEDDGSPHPDVNHRKSIDDSSIKEHPEAFENDQIDRKQQQQAPQQQLSQQQQQTARNNQTVYRALPPGAPANYCNICNKELCNKYFMKTHMQKMHGINLDDLPREAANSGGVVCDICQKELCSKYFLKVHKSNTHGITDFTNSSAGSQAANAATAVAAIALTNYSLNNAQKRAAINMALNQHQLQSRQAAALMNVSSTPASFNPLQMAQAAKAAAIQQREQLYATTILGQLQQQQQTKQQPTTQQSQQPLDLQQTHSSHKQQSHHHQQQQPLQQPQSQTHPPSSLSSTITPSMHVAFPAALFAATVSNPLLAAQLAHHHQQQQQQQQQNQHQQRFSSIENQQASNQHQPNPFFNLNENPIDHEEETSDRESLTGQASDQLPKNRLAIDSFHQQLQNQKALLNATAVFNPVVSVPESQQASQQIQPNPFFNLNESPVDNEDTSDRESPADQTSDQLHKNRLAIDNFHQQLQNQQALLNAAAAFNPAAAAATVMAMQHQQHHQQQQQQHELQLHQQQHQNNSPSSNNNNSRYLRHYTEACPICDRRFKSIKWLQSHVMNDHKNEIENLFKLLVQVLLCGNNVSSGLIGGSNGASLHSTPGGATATNAVTVTNPLSGIISGASGIDGSIATGLSGPIEKASAVGSVDLRKQALLQPSQQANQATSATSTASRGDA